MDAETMKRLEVFLNDHGQSVDTIPPSRLNQLEKIDLAVQTRLTNISAAKETLKNCSVNISTISSDSGISRKTFYNNDLLRLYVESYACDNDTAASAEEIKRFKEKVGHLQEQINAFLIRDIETENLRHENMKLTTEISCLQTRNKNLEEQYAALSREMQKLRSQLSKQTGHIIPLRSPS